MHNQELSDLFKKMAVIYRYLGGEHRFRAMAYQKAGEVIANLGEDIETHIKNHTLEDIDGVGESIASKIEEFISAGKISAFEELKKKVPFELIELLEISGFGPKSLKQIHEHLNISQKEDLIRALSDGRISGLKGFGEKKVENMLRGLKLHKTLEDRMLLWHALNLGEKILDTIRKINGVQKAELAGSLRRKKETIGDIDILICTKPENRKRVIKKILAADFIKKILVSGDTKISVLLMPSDRQADLRIIDADEWGSALQYFTGSKEHNIHLRTLAKKQGYKISEYGLFNLSDNKRIAGKSEKEIYAALGFQIMPPEIREDEGELESAIQNKIPQLIEFNNIKGDLQMHSAWSDGLSTIEQVTEYVRKNFNYEYIVITDHSKSSRIANGMDENRILQQIKEIDQINLKIGNNFVKKGIEVDILSDGTLDISDEILSQLDWVTASIHSGFKGDNTERIIQACNNPYVCCIGHPTGRLIGSREPYKLNFEAIFKAAKETGTSMEINAQPDRMDLNARQVRMAKEMGVKLVISTDAHTLVNFEFMKTGVSVARRGWCTQEDILNTKSWKEIEAFKKKKRAILNKILPKV